jgi:hypothetical protein
MSSLFDKLLQLRGQHPTRTPLEDYFTELFAHLLRDSPEVLLGFVQRFKLTRLPGPLYGQVLTQVRYDRLAGHGMNSRPDLVLELKSTMPQSADTRGMVFIESKVGSTEGWAQLQRYAEHLQAQPGKLDRVLVYVTRKYDPKQKAKVLKNTEPGQIIFRQLRWHQVYSFLKKSFPHQWLAREVCVFMEHNGMAQNPQFNPVDLLALTHFWQAQKLMEHTLQDEVLAALKEFGADGLKQSTALEMAMAQYKRHGRYLLIANQRDALWVGLGYFMPADDPEGYPQIGVMIEISAQRCNMAVEVVAAMQAVAQEQPDRWQPYQLEPMGPYPQIRYLRPLHNFLKAGDHQEQIKRHLLKCLRVVAAIKKQFPNLPWVQGSGH